MNAAPRELGLHQTLVFTALRLVCTKASAGRARRLSFRRPACSPRADCFRISSLLFLLTLLRVVSPAFLLSRSRYAVLGLTAAVLTPTQDVVNLTVLTHWSCIVNAGGFPG